MTTTVPSVTERMLDALHAGCEGLVELRAIPPGNGHPDTTFLKPGDAHVQLRGEGDVRLTFDRDCAD